MLLNLLGQRLLVGFTIEVNQVELMGRVGEESTNPFFPLGLVRTSRRWVDGE